MVSWERALELFSSSAGDRVRWMLVGSAATRVQGVAVDPGDVDVLVHPDTSDDDLSAVAGSLAPFAAAEPVSQDPGSFLSTVDQPLVATADGTWLFGRWIVEGCKLEVARIRADLGPAVVVETMGTAVWATCRTVPWQGHELPVVPLEVQLATIISRGLDERARAVRARFEVSGPDEALLAQAMVDRGVS